MSAAWLAKCLSKWLIFLLVLFDIRHQVAMETLNETLKERLSKLLSRGLLSTTNHQFIQIPFPPNVVDAKNTAELLVSGSYQLLAVSKGQWGATFVKQKSLVACGPVSLLNYVNICDKSCSENLQMFSNMSEENVIDKVEVDNPKFSKEGLTIDELQKFIGNEMIVSCNSPETSPCSSSFTEAAFLSKMIEQINKFGSLILNYDMTTLGQSPGRGHFSLAVAVANVVEQGKWRRYLLLLDCWPETPVAWVPVSDMFKAMNTVDSASQQFRGFLERQRPINDA